MTAVRLLLVGLFALAAGPVFAEEPIMIGVSGPLTGPYARYGAEWRRGFDLAVGQTNAAGGINGRPIAYRFEDSQSDPRQAVAIAQKFVADPSIVVELGDFSSAASPIYQRGKLVQFGFTNSHPDFTKGGDYMWGNAPSQADDMPAMADYAVRTLGLKKLGVLFINHDWGRSSKDIFVTAAEQRGAKVVAAEGYLPAEMDFRSMLVRVRVRDADPDGIILISYYPDGALIARQTRSVGLTQFGTDRQAIHDGLGKVRDVPSIIYGRLQFDPANRRVKSASNVELLVRDGRFTLRDGAMPPATH